MKTLLHRWLPVWLLALALGVIIGLCSCVTVQIVPNRTRVAKKMLKEMQALELSSRDVLHYVDSCQCSVTDSYRDSVFQYYLKQMK